MDSPLNSLRLTAARLERQIEERTHELRIAKDAAEAANRTKGVFLASMSHELRTPLNAILGFCHLLRQDADTETQREALEIMDRSGEHLLHLIDDVLDVAKIEAGRTALEVGPCDLGSLLRDVVNMMRGRAEEKKLHLLTVSSPEFPRYVRTDARRLRQVLINLLGNAIKYTDQGTVTLRLNATATEPDRRLLTFDVEDTGPGIAQEEQARIFEAFVQVGETGMQPGTGLGLTISRQIVELMGGKITLESTPGTGSRFRVELPVELARESELVPPPVSRRKSIGLEPGQPEYRILVCDDEPNNAKVLQRFLEHAGFQVQVGVNGLQAVEMFRDWRPHFIWVDLRMPGMGGAEATRRIRVLEGGREVKIAAVSASTFAEERSEVMAAGMDDFVRKPHRATEVFDCMARHLGVRYRRSDGLPASFG